MTTNDHLTEIKARAEAATNGPWECAPVEFPEQVGYSIKSRAGSVVLFGGYGPRGGTSEANALMAAHARTDVPQLVTALEAVLEVHSVSLHTALKRGMYCDHCGHRLPCPTVQAVTKALGAGQ